MANLAGQRANFTWAVNQYNLAEDDVKREDCAKRIAKYLKASLEAGFTIKEITRDIPYPVAEVEKYMEDAIADGGSEQEAIKAIAQAVDTSDVVYLGQGTGVVYAYGYRCIGDRLKVGSTEADAIQRISAQISTSTPDKPVLYLEIKTDNCRVLERAIQATLEARGKKVSGGGAEWFKTNTDEIRAIYEFVRQQPITEYRPPS